MAAFVSSILQNTHIECVKFNEKDISSINYPVHVLAYSGYKEVQF